MRPASPPMAIPAEPVALDGAATLGSTDAPVVVIEYSDFSCPFCARFANGTLGALKAEFVEGGRVAFAYKHLPLDALHPNARGAAAAAECAGAQGRFWEMHDALFANVRQQDDASLLAYAATLGLNEGRFRACLADEAVRARVERHADEAERFGLTGTPAFLVGIRQPDGRIRVTEGISGARPMIAFQEAIARAMAAVATGDTQ